MAAESDEKIARQLQAKFDTEDATYQQQVMMDANLAASVAKAHEMSDSASDSDSDATIEPPGYSSSLDGSQDLFDNASVSPSFRSKGSTLSSSPGAARYRIKANSSTLSKKISKTHEISGSDSDSAEDVRQSKAAVNCCVKKNLTSPHKSSSSTGAGATLSQGYQQKGSALSPRSSSSTSSAQLQHQADRTDLSPKPSVSVESSHPKHSAASSSSTSSTTKLSGLTVSVSSVSRMEQSRGGCRETSATKPACKYGDRCFRTNPQHYQDFHHEGETNGKRKNSPQHDKDGHTAKKRLRTDEELQASQSHTHKQEQRVDEFDKTVVDIVSEFQPLSFFLTKVSGIDDRFNNTGAVSLKDILSPLMGNLQASCQFNYMFDIPWLVSQYPKQFRDKPLLLVHGEQRQSEAELKREAKSFPHISLCRAKLEIVYGTHHTKMMLLLYDCGMRVVIHTANLVSNDWYQKTQGVWISPLFPKLPDTEGAPSARTVRGDSATKFKSELLAYLAAYSAAPLAQWERHIQQHDFTAASVYIIGSVPGRHAGDRKTAWGHLRLRKVLQEAGPEKTEVGSWPVIGQFSSIGSLGASPDQWLCSEWLDSLSQCRGMMGTPLHHSKLQLVYPSKENVRLCLEGYSGGGCLPYSIKTAQKQVYLNNFVRKWGSEGRGRTEAIPHIKTYTRVSPDFTHAAWFLVTSANLSKAAWGALEKQKTQLMIRSYEIGVLFLPRHFGGSGSFHLAKSAEEVRSSDQALLPFPYDLPPPTYQKGDRIWMWDVPCVDLPDTHGKKYCPTL